MNQSRCCDGLMLASVCVLALAASMVLGLGGCDVDRSGFAINFNDSLTSLTVRPQIICPGESVNVSWQTSATTIGVDDCDGGSSGVICAGERTLNALVFLTSSPTDLFALPGNRVDSSETTGSRAFMPEVNTTFTLVAGYEDLGFTRPRERSVRVIRPEDGSVHRTETFVWGCTSAGGAAGWGDIHYERGEVATDRVRIVSVRNVSGFGIRLLVNRPELNPPVAYFEFYEGNDLTEVFNGEYYGEWVASPLAPGAFFYPDCTVPATIPGPLDSVPGTPPISPPVEVPSIVLEVTVACAEGGI